MARRSLIGAIMVVAAIVVPAGHARAQQAQHSASRLMFDSNLLDASTMSADVSTPAAIAKPDVMSNVAKPNDGARAPLRLERTDTTTGSSRVRPQTSSPSNASFGRIPLESGSLGFETETRLKANEFPDGRRIPGLDHTHRHTPTYFGLSLSVPTESKSFQNEPPLRSHTD